MKQNKTYVLLLVTSMLAACNAAGSGSAAAELPKTPAESVDALEQQGKIPTLDRSSSLAGTDANGNGVRDDVDAYILANFSAAEQPVALQMAKSVQIGILVDKTDKQAVRDASLKSSLAIHCIHYKFPGEANYKIQSRIFNEIIAVTTNTKQRLLADLALSKAVDGHVMSLPEGDTCE
jgi:hypothetical protein